MKVKNTAVSFIILFAAIFITNCNKYEKDPVGEVTGKLEFRCINPIASSLKKETLFSGSKFSNPPLTGDTTKTIMTSLRFAIGDVWISRGEIKAGEPDTLEWIRLTGSTNTELKLFEEYLVPSIDIPAGNYKSIKVTLRSIIYRQVKLVSDMDVVYELLESIGSSGDPCDPKDTTWAKTNYFGSVGNHYLDDNGVFKLASRGEKISGFDIKPGKKASVYWRFGAGAITPCINYLIDKNSNREWDCGIDKLRIDCPPEVINMWDFIVEYD